MSFRFNRRRKTLKIIKRDNSIDVFRFGAYPFEGWDSTDEINNVFRYCESYDGVKVYFSQGVYNGSGAIEPPMVRRYSTLKDKGELTVDMIRDDLGYSCKGARNTSGFYQTTEIIKGENR